MKHILPVFLFILCSYPAFSQYEQVVFNYESSQFNNGQPLPSEELFVLTGQVSSDVDMVEAVIARKGLLKGDEKPIFTGQWVRDYDDQSNDWQIPVNYKLKQNEEYDVMIRYFTTLQGDQRQELGYTLKEQLLNYLDQEILIEEKEVELREAPGKVYNNLNQILAQSTGNLRNRLESNAPAFSDIVKEGIQKLDDLDLKDADELLGGDSLNTEGQKRYQYARQQINTVKRQIISETDQMFYGDLSILTSRKIIRNYPTEKKRSHINVLVGYGTVYNERGSDEDFGSGWYGGVSIPLGHPAHSSKIWSNTALSVGVFFQDLEFDDGAYTYSGPVVDRPSFVALGYKVFNFLRIQAGASFLQLESDDSGLLDVSDVEIRPYVGLSAELKLWIGTNE
ncbi:hypothetical protein AB9P05_00485 [Roseivirga sp. BDSF3-8]|uniref:hypothetical protein n=1 Tax=Roseivirga sp. BDSF3-8 TaxID=3241598 RepID=UPI0035322811